MTEDVYTAYSCSISALDVWTSGIIVFFPNSRISGNYCVFYMAAQSRTWIGQIDRLDWVGPDD